MTHTSACAVHNMPAGPCDCGAWAIADRLRSRLHMPAMLERPENYGTTVPCVDILEAADEIERLRAEIIAAERRGRVRELHHAAAKALRYAERELYDELTARANAIEAGE